MKVKSKVLKGRADRIKKLTAKGVDPNFIDPETGGKKVTLSKIFMLFYWQVKTRCSFALRLSDDKLILVTASN
jgi:hypothetical protein